MKGYNIRKLSQLAKAQCVISPADSPDAFEAIEELMNEILVEENLPIIGEDFYVNNGPDLMKSRRITSVLILGHSLMFVVSTRSQGITVSSITISVESLEVITREARAKLMTADELVDYLLKEREDIRLLLRPVLTVQQLKELPDLVRDSIENLKKD